MFNKQLNIPIILLLILPIGHVPVPWVHSHEFLSGEQLSAHLNENHSGIHDGSEETGWHLHILCMGFEDSGSIGDYSATGTELMKALAAPPVSSALIAAIRPKHRELFCALRVSVRLYQRHCSLLL